MGAFNRRTYNQTPYNAPGLAYEPPDSLRPDVRAIDPAIEDTRSIDPQIHSTYTGPPRYNVVLSQFVAGDTFWFRRTFNRLDTSRTQITRVYLTLNIGTGTGVIFAGFPAVATTTEPIRQSIILQISTPDSPGEITDANPSDGAISFFAFLPPSRTVGAITYPGTIDLTPGQEYSYDFQAVNASGLVCTFETGVIIPGQP